MTLDWSRVTHQGTSGHGYVVKGVRLLFGLGTLSRVLARLRPGFGQVAGCGVEWLRFRIF
jgi:hypothetical protein